ncbi:MAG: saccharopine dehydrogenase NADP-binding domain-containing protein [Candidatus Eisenbacteria bacterium]|nr:saccharopine dehydrogenase NADP-binding domain-containing protein [Candidatus Eisenbacteria bacterium]
MDAGDPEALGRLFRGGDAVCVDLLPIPLHAGVVRAAVRAGVHVVTASYPGDEMEDAGEEARRRGLALLPGLGMDPGIDLVLLGEAARRLDHLTRLLSYGAGFPARGADDNPLRYKVTWNFEGTVRSYHRSARIIREGRAVVIPAGMIFDPSNIHTVHVDGQGELEAYPNGDAAAWLDHLDADLSGLREFGRYVLRRPGHAAVWKMMADLGLLDDEPVEVGGASVDRKSYLAEALGPRLRYRPGERDVVVVRVDAEGTRAGRPLRVRFELTVLGDERFTAMSRTVGFPAAIGARMIADGAIPARGLLSPERDVPFAPFAAALADRGLPIRVDESPRAGKENR